MYKYVFVLLAVISVATLSILSGPETVSKTGIMENYKIIGSMIPAEGEVPVAVWIGVKNGIRGADLARYYNKRKLDFALIPSFPAVKMFTDSLIKRGYYAKITPDKTGDSVIVELIRRDIK